MFYFIFEYLIQKVKNLHAMQETRVRYLGQKDPLEKGMATHSSLVGYNAWGHRVRHK